MLEAGSVDANLPEAIRMRGVTTIIMAGGQGSRLYPLTKDRAKPSVPFAAKYRLIDIAMSNCLHSELNRILILTQFNSASLNQHVAETYLMGTASRFSVQILAAEQTFENRDWYQGTADAVRRNLIHLYEPQRKVQDFLILAGDHFYRMDYREFVDRHRDTEADISIAVLPVTESDASRFGILKVDREGWIRDFVEKPKTADQLDGLAATNATDPDRPYLASMGIYVIRADLLRELLANTDDVDFGHHVIPKSVGNHRVMSFPFHGYWEDIGTMRSYFQANLDLLDTLPKFDLYNETAPIFTYRHQLPPTKVNASRVTSSMLAEGVIIDNSTIVRSLIGTRGVVRDGTHMDSTYFMGADYYESAASIAEHAERGIPAIGIGRNCRIRRAILDKNVRVGDDVALENRQGLASADDPEQNWFIRDGIIVVPKNAVIPAGTVV